MPSLINELIFDEVKSIVDESESLLLIDPAGLKADESLALRRQLSGIGAHMKVAKRRVVRHVVSKDVQPYLDGKGTVGVVAASDITAAAKIINTLVKDEKVTVRAGVVEGRALDGRAAASLADLPSKEELQAKLLGTLQGPMGNFVRLLNEVPSSFARLLAAYRDEKSE
jgi:large subunit ribosomal protein L10